MSDSVRPQRWQPTRLPRPWDSPGKNIGVGCHFLLQCMKVKIESDVAQSCPTSDPMDCSRPGSSIHGIFQARVLEWVNTAFSVWHLKHKQMLLPYALCPHPGIPCYLQAVFVQEINSLLTMLYLCPISRLPSDARWVPGKTARKLTFVFDATLVFTTKQTPLLKSTCKNVWKIFFFFIRYTHRTSLEESLQNDSIYQVVKLEIFYFPLKHYLFFCIYQ